VNFSSDRGKTWILENSKSDAMLLSISAYGNTAITVGTEGTIRYTLNNGENWDIPQSITSLTLKCVVLLDEKTGVAVGDSGIILKTEDCGKNWKQIKSEISSKIISAFVTKSKTILIATTDGKMYESSDDGDTWIQKNIPIGFFNPRKFNYSLDNKIYLLTENVLLKSDDDGETWQCFNNPDSKREFCCYLRNGSGLIGGAKFSSSLLKIESDTTVIDTIKLTKEFGEILPSAIKNVAFFDENDGIVIGVYGFIFITSDGGKNWIEISNFYTYPPDGRISVINFINDSVGFIGTHKETLYKTNDKGITWHYVKKDSLRGMSSSITSIFFFDENVGMMNSNQYNGTLLLTYNGGLNIKRDTASNYLNGANYGFDFLKDSSFLFIGWRWFYNVDHTYYGLREFNGTWQNKGVFDSCKLGSRYFYKDKIFLSGYFIDSCKLPDEPNIYYRGLIVKSDDNCKTWKRTYFDTMDVIRGVEFIDDNLGYAFGNGYIYGKENATVFYRTTDGGETWHFFSNDTNIIRKVATLRGLNAKYSIGMGREMKYLITTDNGANWSDIPFPTNFTLQKFYATENYFYIIGMWGSYNILLRLKLKDEYISVDEETQSLPAPLAYMSVPYPNPANEYTNFDIIWDKRFDLNELNFSISNIFGQKIEKPKLELYGKTINTATIRWNTGGVPRGLYVFQLEVDGYQRAHKVIVY